MTRRWRVLIIDDSPFVCQLLTRYLETAEDLSVVGHAFNAEEGLRQFSELRPDVVTLDVEMPRMSGLEILESIMVERPTPVVMVSGVSRRGAVITLEAMELGAADFILKFAPGVDTDPETLRRDIVSKVRSAAQIPLEHPERLAEAGATARGWRQTRRLERKMRTRVPSRPGLDPVAASAGQLARGIIVVGSSTGGPLALREMLFELSPTFPYAILVVQHMPAAFTTALARQLTRQVPLSVKEAEVSDPLQPGKAYIAPGDRHVMVLGDGRIELNDGPRINGQRPSIDVAMQSAVRVYGPNTVGVLLSGMGSDGTRGLAAIRAKGGRTLVQDVATCVIPSMPQHAVTSGVVDHALAPKILGRLLMKLKPA